MKYLILLIIVFFPITSLSNNWNIISGFKENVNAVTIKDKNIVFDQNNKLISFNTENDQSKEILELNNDDYFTSLYYWNEEKTLFTGVQDKGNFWYEGKIYWTVNETDWKKYDAGLLTGDLLINEFTSNFGSCFAAISGKSNYGGYIAKYSTEEEKWSNDYPTDIGLNLTEEMYSIISIPNNNIYSFGYSKTGSHSQAALYIKDFHENNNWQIFDYDNTKFDNIIALTYDSTNNYLYAIIDDMTLVYSDDNGNNFHTINEFQVNSKVLDIRIIGKELFAGTEEDGLYVYDLINKVIEKSTLNPLITRINKIESNDNIIALATNNGIWFTGQKTQNESLSISGSITDCYKNENKLINVNVVLERDGNEIASDFTDENGEFVFSELDSGLYKINFFKNGFIKKDTTIKINDNDLDLDICLNKEKILSDKYLDITVIDSCSNLPIENAKITYIYGPWNFIDSTDSKGKAIKNIDTNSIIKIKVEYENYFTETKNLNIVEDTTFIEFKLKKKFPFEIDLTSDKKEYYINDKVKVSNKIISECMDEDDYSFYIVYNPYELHLLSHDYDIIDSSGMAYSDYLSNDESLEFLVLIGRDSVNSIISYGFYNDNRNIFKSEHIDIKTHQPFKIRKKYGGIISSINPNPSGGNIEIICDIYQETNYSLYLSDAAGNIIRELSSGILTQGKAKFKDSIDLPPGAYYINLRSDKSNFTYPVIIK